MSARHQVNSHQVTFLRVDRITVPVRRTNNFSFSCMAPSTLITGGRFPCLLAPQISRQSLVSTSPQKCPLTGLNS